MAVVRASVSLSPIPIDPCGNVYHTAVAYLSAQGPSLLPITYMLCAKVANIYSGRFRGCMRFTSPPKDGCEYSTDC